MTLRIFFASVITLAVCGRPVLVDADDPPATNIYGADNLVAWCIVPFDANKRGPAERAKMLARLGVKRVAYDWRAEHVATFEEEILQYKKHDLDYFAFWSWHDAMEPLIKKHGIKPQIWSTAPSPQADTQQTRIKAAATAVLPLVEKTRTLGCRFGLYNHGGWGGTRRIWLPSVNICVNTMMPTTLASSTTSITVMNTWPTSATTCRP